MFNSSQIHEGSDSGTLIPPLLENDPMFPTTESAGRLAVTHDIDISARRDHADTGRSLILKIRQER